MRQEVPRKIYAFWTGRCPMSPTRQSALETMRRNLGVPIELVDWRRLHEYILPDVPLHPGFRFLSDIHRSDYLRCYFMHFYGGGYADIKHYTQQNNWNLCFDMIQQFPKIQIIGMPEMDNGTPVPEFQVRSIIDKLITVCYFIVRPQSAFSKSWYESMMRKMDFYYSEVKRNPATDPFGGMGYPIPWAALLGDVFHRIVMEFRAKDPNAVSSALLCGRDWTKGWR